MLQSALSAVINFVGSPQSGSESHTPDTQPISDAAAPDPCPQQRGEELFPADQTAKVLDVQTNIPAAGTATPADPGTAKRKKKRLSSLQRLSSSPSSLETSLEQASVKSESNGPMKLELENGTDAAMTETANEDVKVEEEKKEKEKEKEKERKEQEKKEKKEQPAAGEMVSVEWERGPLYEYDELLTRLYKIIEDKNPTLGAVKKYMLKPPTTVRVGSKKVGWVNFAEICEMMKRPTDHVMQFVLAEFGTEGSITENGQLILKGRYLPKHLESLLRKYIREFVTCEMCKSANTLLQRDASSRLHLVSCENCNASRTAASIKSGYHSVTRADRRAAKQAKL